MSSLLLMHRVTCLDMNIMDMHLKLCSLLRSFLSRCVIIFVNRLFNRVDDKPHIEGVIEP